MIQLRRRRRIRHSLVTEYFVSKGGLCIEHKLSSSVGIYMTEYRHTARQITFSEWRLRLEIMSGDTQSKICVCRSSTRNIYQRRVGPYVSQSIPSRFHESASRLVSPASLAVCLRHHRRDLPRLSDGSENFEYDVCRRRDPPSRDARLIRIFFPSVFFDCASSKALCGDDHSQRALVRSRRRQLRGHKGVG